MTNRFRVFDDTHVVLVVQSDHGIFQYKLRQIAVSEPFDGSYVWNESRTCVLFCKSELGMSAFSFIPIHICAPRPPDHCQYTRCLCVIKVREMPSYTSNYLSVCRDRRSRCEWLWRVWAVQKTVDTDHYRTRSCDSWAD